MRPYSKLLLSTRMQSSESESESELESESDDDLSFEKVDEVELVSSSLLSSASEIMNGLDF